MFLVIMRSAFVACILLVSAQAETMESKRAHFEAFLDKHCYECHDDLDPEAGLDLLNTEFNPTDPANFAIWEKVFRKVHSGEMPPKENKLPHGADLETFLFSLGTVLTETDSASIERSGRVQSRRLTREEYENTLHDLLGVGVKLEEALTADSDEGFANTASHQQLSHFHLESYMEAADIALEEAFSRSLGKDPSFERTYRKKELTAGVGEGNYRGPEPSGNDVISWAMGVQFYGRLPATLVPEDGWYEVTLRNVRGINRGEDGAVWATLNSRSGQSNEPLQFPIGLVEGAKDASDQTFRAWIRKGHTLILKPSEGGAKAAPSNVVGKDGGTVIFNDRNLEKQGYHGLRFSEITVKRIHPNGDRAAGMANLFLGLTEKEIRQGPPEPSRFIESFTDQWLELRDIDSTQPDPKRFVNFDPIVQQSMVDETRAFLAELFLKDLSVTHFLKSDFTFLNTRLKEHYSIGGVALEAGSGLAKVKLPSGSRSGLLTQGAILKVTADGSVTSPVVRGVFVNERILGLHIDPPPPNIPAIEPDIRGAVSIREQLDKHRNSKSCASCHAKIDPPGFALEEFDPVGNLREFYGRPKKSAKIDSSGTTADGRDFRNYAEWRDLHLSRPETLAEAFVGQLLRYGTGGEIRFSDKEVLKKITGESRKQGYGLRSLLKATLTSPLFLEK